MDLHIFELESSTIHKLGRAFSIESANNGIFPVVLVEIASKDTSLTQSDQKWIKTI